MGTELIFRLLPLSMARSCTFLSVHVSMPHASIPAGSLPRNRTVASKSAGVRVLGVNAMEVISLPKGRERDGVGLWGGREAQLFC